MKNDPNAWTGSDSERIEAALDYAVKNGLPLEITRRQADDGRDHWLIDRAILLPGGCTVRIRDCVIRLSDACRDNFFRSANCGYGIADIRPVSGIRILGEGNAVLRGAARPRATGDSGKTLGEHTFGTDAGKPGENPKGDWRNIGILFAHVDDFAIEGLQIEDPHAWSVSLEYCSHGRVRNMRFRSSGGIAVDGRRETVLNQDGVDLRRGCHDIVIEDISGYTGDDLVALTALPSSPTSPPTGTFWGTEITRGGTGPDAELHHVTIRRVSGYCAGGHHIVRLLNNRGVKLHDISIEDVADLSPEGFHDKAALKIGDSKYGGAAPLGDTYGVTVRSLRSRAQNGILIGGTLADSTVSGLVQEYAGGAAVSAAPETLRNVEFPK